ncbi:cupin domain-containing protein [Epibacterium sp. SM1969]|uniref:Cupin domain-containing protein n=1 Tax=Tritonibacter aquimaris TaxID=2663379 RepID=A0A844AN63_9RHOB|nr:cupin domain-containing protein [Tritonibacter aquimaris]MQY43915.1 cupin domain-containing protein [Tritonibacter aquimaris]
MKTILKTAALLATLATAAVAHEPPSEHKGVSVFGKAALELGTQIPAMEGYKVQIRSVVVETGGIVKFHTHDTRPGAFYVAKGDGVREFQGADDKVGRIIKAGEAVLEDHDTDHWLKNEGGEALFFVFDIVPSK